MSAPELFTEEHRQMLRDQAEADAAAVATQGASEVSAAVLNGPAAVPPPEPPVFPEASYSDFATALTVRLYHPLSMNGHRIEQIEIVPPRFDHVEAWLEKRISQLALYASMCGLSEAELGALRWPDATRIMSICSLYSE